MILLDTNVVSEVMKAVPLEIVVDWLNGQNSSSLYVSAITIGEIAYGLRILPDGFISLAFAQRVLAYDEPAARIYGEIMGSRKESGRPMSVADGQIASIARSKHLTVATRNTVDFEECGVDLIDPFIPTI
jgi:predicted nucleic acid-binding protein